MVKIILSIVIVIIFILLVGFLLMTRGMGRIKNMFINDLDLESIPDGTYQGSFEGSRWSNDLSVTVKDHQITGINITKFPLFHEEKDIKPVIEQILEKQSLVDVVSGATVTKKAILASVANALKE